jgi:EpsG family
MPDNKAIRLRRLFAYLALAVCGALAFRPIPGLLDSNDTGRYVTFQEDACQSSVSDDDSGIQQWTFDLLARPACLSGGPKLFLLLVGGALPVAFIIFGEWRAEGALLLGAGLLLSVVGFELATNAMRQAVSLSFLLAAISLDNKIGRLLALCLAVLLHVSNLIFVPWVFLLNREEWRLPKLKAYMLVLLVLVAAIGWHYFKTDIADQMYSGATLLQAFQDIYEEPLSPGFLIFMVLPLCWVFGVRWFSSKVPLPRGEKVTFFYSAIIIALTIAFFPMITYRLAMTATVLQMFVAMRAVDLSFESGAWISTGLAAHFLIYAFVSQNVRAVLHV